MSRTASRRVALVTNMPSYHQIDLFNAIAAAGRFPFRVFYLRRITPGRQWTRLVREIRHDCTFVEEVPIHPYFYLNRGLWPALRDFAPDLYVVTQYASIAMQAIMWKANLAKTPWVFWSEAGGVEYTENPIVRTEWLRRFLRGIALLPVRRGPLEVWGVGSRGAGYFQGRVHCPVRCYPYYADLGRFLAIERAPAAHIRFVFLGKLIRRKGVDVLVAAIRLLRDQGLAPEVAIVGDGPERPAVEALAAEHSDCVRYLGFRELDEIPGVLTESDVLICPSRFDGWGMVVVEGMAAGLPVISTTATTAAVDLDVGRGLGWLVEPGNPSQLADAMRACMSARDTLPALGARCRQRAMDYDSAIGAERFCANIEALGRP